jgi:hypothetical protein
MLGKQHSPESKLAMSQKKKDLYNGENNPMFGKSHSDAAKKKVAAFRKGKIWIHKDMVCKSVSLDELEEFLSDGWSRGRTMDIRASEKYIMSLIENGLTD